MLSAKNEALHLKKYHTEEKLQHTEEKLDKLRTDLAEIKTAYNPRNVKQREDTKQKQISHEEHYGTERRTNEKN